MSLFLCILGFNLYPNFSMKKIICLIVLGLFFQVSNAQKIKVKKDKVIYDNVAVATVKTSRANVFEYSSLIGNGVIEVTFNKTEISDGKFKEWLDVKEFSQDRSSHIDMKWLSISMNRKKAVAELLAKSYNVITEKGIQNLDDFFSEERPNLEDKYSKQANELVEMTDEYNKAVRTLLSIYSVDDTGNVVNKQKDAVVAKFYDRTKNRNTLQLGDMKKMVIAKVGVGLNDTYRVKTYDGKSFKIDNSQDMPTVTLRKLVLKELLKHGYGEAIEYGVGVTKEKDKEEQLESLAEKKESSSNIYKKKGYIIDGKNIRYDGVITLQFKMFKEDFASTSGNIVSLDNPDKSGKFVSIFYVNSKGRKKNKSFKAKKPVQVIILNEDGTETKYKGYDVKKALVSAEDDALDLGALTANNSKFYEIVSEKESYTILRNPVDSSFGVKVLSVKKALFFEETSPQTNLRRFLKYSGASCEFSDDLKTVDYKDLSQINKILQYYENNCK